MPTLALLFATQLALAQTPELSAPPPMCTIADCPAGQGCDNGVCRAWCAFPKDCESGLVCSGHHWLSDGKRTKGMCRSGDEGDPCEDSKECAPRLTCSGPPTSSSEASCTAAQDPSTLERLPRLSATSPARFKFTGSVPAGHRLVYRPLLAPVIGGAGAFAAAYAVSVLAGASQANVSGAIPLVGPLFLTAANWRSGSFSGIDNAFVLFAGVSGTLVQAASLVVLVIGFAAGDRWLEPEAPKLTLLPTVSSDSVGASLVGRF